jgi:hypothetical protein
VQANVFRAMILTAAQLGTYDHIKHTILRLHLLADGPACHFSSSICAGIVMATATSPVDIIKTRLMNQPTGNHSNPLILYRCQALQWFRGLLQEDLLQ